MYSFILSVQILLSLKYIQITIPRLFQFFKMVYGKYKFNGDKFFNFWKVF
jgi:hypothetical protein